MAEVTREQLAEALATFRLEVRPGTPSGTVYSPAGERLERMPGIVIDPDETARAILATLAAMAAHREPPRPGREDGAPVPGPELAGHAAIALDWLPLAETAADLGRSLLAAGDTLTRIADGVASRPLDH